MKKVFLLLILLLLTTMAFITNPKPEAHKEKICTELMNRLEQLLPTSGASGVKKLLHMGINEPIKEFVNANLHIDNYFLFSTSSVTWENEEKRLSFGFFGNVLLNQKAFEAISKDIKEQIGQLKNDFIGTLIKILKPQN